MDCILDNFSNNSWRNNMDTFNIIKKWFIKNQNTIIWIIGLGLMILLALRGFEVI